MGQTMLAFEKVVTRRRSPPLLVILSMAEKQGCYVEVVTNMG